MPVPARPRVLAAAALAAAVAAAALVAALAHPRAWGQPLPDLGDVSSSSLSPQMERRIGESIVREIRARDPTYLDDPEVQDYLRTLGARLVDATPSARQAFEFFPMRDASVNAFALPGGYIGIHTGLVAMADSESELAAVVAHEIAHVTQRHIARQVSDQEKTNIPVAVGMIAALLAARSRPDLATGFSTAIQGAQVQRFLNYSRDFEREADRVGLQSLAAAGFDPRAMGQMFDKMQRATRVMDDGTFPGYLRTHPLTTERIADAENRAATLPYRQRVDSIEFHLVRARLRAEQLEPVDAVAAYEGAVRERRFANEAGARYGLVTALLRAQRPADAAAELGRLRALRAESPMIELLEARVRQARGDVAGALEVLRTARARYASHRPLVYATGALLMDTGRAADAGTLAAEQLRLHPGDERLHAMQARALALQGKRLGQHRAQAEVYALQGNLVGAIEQLQFAQSAGDGDFYELSAVDARLRQLREAHAAEQRDQKRR